MAKKNCTKVGLAEKSKAAAGEEIRERQIGILVEEYTDMKKSHVRFHYESEHGIYIYSDII